MGAPAGNPSGPVTSTALATPGASSAAQHRMEQAFLKIG